jgi:CDP-diacylglycerol--serine O-phosphatidyltransferase
MSMARNLLSMLRSYTPADFLTIGNASCGTISIFLCLDYLATGNSKYVWIRLRFVAVCARL